MAKAKPPRVSGVMYRALVDIERMRYAPVSVRPALLKRGYAVQAPISGLALTDLGRQVLATCNKAQKCNRCSRPLFGGRVSDPAGGVSCEGCR